MCPGMRNGFWASQNKGKSVVGYIYVCEIFKFLNFIEKNGEKNKICFIRRSLGTNDGGMKIIFLAAMLL